MTKYVIVGASAAGIGATEAIRELDPDGSLTVISDEIYPQYSRPMISDFIVNKTNFDKMKFRTDDFWTKNKAQTRFDKKAIKLKPKEKTIILEDGEKITYEKLLIATGGKPVVPKIEGSEKEGVFTFTTIKDAESLAAKIESSNVKSAVVIGAGLIGISVTEALIKKGLKVTIVELQDKILSLILDTKASELFEEIISKAGVNIVTGQSVQKITGKPNNKNTVGGIILTKGDQVSCDLVIMAIGVAPRTELLVETPIKINRGIVVDETMRTNIPDIYASGDVAEAYDLILNQNRLLPLWPLAMLGGQVAGYNMAGKKTIYKGETNMSSLKYFGVPIVSVGLANPKNEPTFEVLVNYDVETGSYKKLVIKNNIIIGMTMVNCIERAGIFFYLIKNAVNIKKIKQQLLSNQFCLATLPTVLQKKMRVIQ